MKNPLVKCAACAGTGKVELDEKSKLALSMVKQFKKSSALSLHGLMRYKNNETIGATNNRLKKLMAAGLVTRQKSDGLFRYSAVLAEKSIKAIAKEGK